MKWTGGVDVKFDGYQTFSHLHIDLFWQSLAKVLSESFVLYYNTGVCYKRQGVGLTHTQNFFCCLGSEEVETCGKKSLLAVKNAAIV